jgi:hypothetical protein
LSSDEGSVCLRPKLCPCTLRSRGRETLEEGEERSVGMIGCLGEEAAVVMLSIFILIMSGGTILVEPNGGSAEIDAEGKGRLSLLNRGRRTVVFKVRRGLGRCGVTTAGG